MMTCLFDNKVLSTVNTVFNPQVLQCLWLYFLEKVFSLTSGILQHDSILVYTALSSMIIGYKTKYYVATCISPDAQNISVFSD